ncbi:MAG: YhjD/YihY/BrkB family envelope integrity protein [Clostridia bacterium]|nr:YhjD/YihY/BrkB family envelope integrity protein [Clostridia bacterium]
MITFIRNLYLKFKPFMDKINNDNIYANAGQSAFYIILSAVPLTMFIVSMFQNLHISVEYIQSALSFIFSEQIVDYVTSFLTDMYENSVGISFISLIVTLWSAAKGIQAITNGLNRIYDAYENRNWLYLRIRAMIYTVVLFVIIIATLVIIVLGSTINKILAPYFAYLPEVVGLLYSFRFVIIFMYLVVIFALLYRNFPNISRAEHKEYGFRSQLPGAFLCTF